MKCKDEAELHEEYARVIRMCKGTEVNPSKCVRHNIVNKLLSGEQK